MKPRRNPRLLLGSLIFFWPQVLEGQESGPKAGTDGVVIARTAETPVDLRFRSPRATARTFLIAMNQAEDDPHRIEDAVACLDLSEIPSDRRHGGRFAFELEFILRSTNIPTNVISDLSEGTECEIGEVKDTKIKLHRLPDGRWLFDGKTLESLPKMRLLLWEQALAAGQGKDLGDVPADFRSPYATFRTYVAALKQENMDEAAACLDLTEIPDPARRIVGRELAFKLKEVLDRNVFIIFQDLPDTSVGLPLEAVVHREGRITAERQVSGKRKGQWLFNQATVRSVDRLYDEFESKPLVQELASIGIPAPVPSFRHTPGLWVRRRIPDWLRTRIGPSGAWSLAAYQLVGMVLLVLLVVPVYRLVVWLAFLFLRSLMSWRSSLTDDRELRSWVRPIGWLAASWMLVEGVTILDLRMEAAGSLLAFLVPVYWLVAALAAYQLIDPALKIVAGPALSWEGATTLAAMGYPVLSLVFKILVVASGLAALLNLYEFDVGTVLAGLGIGGLAFALAAQDTLKNFFGSLMLIADRTFRIGDLVKIGDQEGVVESVGLRTTRIRGLDDSLQTIPNADLTTAHVTNLGARRYRRFQAHITVPHGTPPDRLIECRDGILELIRRQTDIRQEKSEVALNDLGSSGVEILVQAYFDVSDGHAELIARDGLILEIVRLADRLGISLK
ncbi:mechanosensitive ion channel family protein (plasmid) [Tundrisphaera lichenicola]|uniref:mechanosensitive ion channel family protein n=1 Tax=Tundrisphaera lichenicola TaxID=2029860 RepID=UPI003EBCF571